MWGYRYPEGKFAQLEGIVGSQATYLDDVAVAKCNRVRGVGTALLEAYLNRSRELGFEEAILRTSPKNDAAVAFFKKLGYAQVERNGAPLIDPAYGGIYMRRQL